MSSGINNINSTVLSPTQSPVHRGLNVSNKASLAAANTHSPNVKVPIPNNLVSSSELKSLASKITVLPIKSWLRRSNSASDLIQPSVTKSPVIQADPVSSAIGLTDKPISTQVNNPKKSMAQTLSGAPVANLPRRENNNIPAAFPSKEQAIIIQSVDGITIAQYLSAVAKIVGPKNIIFASRMSLGRVAFYFQSKKQVDNFILDHGGVVIGDQFLPARRMATRAERLVLSNVCPSIPHEVLVEQLSKFVKVVSPINFIALGVKENGLEHVLSFRRQVYVVREEQRQFADSFLVPFDGESYRVFLSFDDIKCFKCRKTGHVARNCVSGNTLPEKQLDNVDFPLLVNSGKRKATDSTEDEQSSKIDEIQVSDLVKDPSENILPLLTSNIAHDDSNIDITNSEDILANESSLLDCSIEKMIIDSVTVEQATVSTVSADKEKQPHKKIKKNLSNECSLPEAATELPQAAIAILNMTDKSALSSSAFQQFITEVKGHDHPLRVAQRYTEDVPGLITMLVSIQPGLISDRAIKERVKRLIANLRKTYAFYSETGDDTGSLTRSLSNESLSSRQLE